MEFHPHETPDSNSAQRYVWDNLKQAFKEDPGDAYYRYHIFPRNRIRRCEPDILLLHQTLGLFILECKGCKIENLEAIYGCEWRMTNWYEESETPLQQAEDQMFAVKGRYDERRETRELVSYHFAVALPHITRAEWKQKGFAELTNVLLREDLFPKTIRSSLEKLSAEHPQKKLTAEEWSLAQGVLRGHLPTADPRAIPSGTPADSLARVVREIEKSLKVLDAEQNEVAFQIPEGPQRVRGLAGTGKTVLFAQRAAKMHARHPDWRIAYVFFTKSLYDQVRALIDTSYTTMTGETPCWENLEILHAWGQKQLPGLYSNLARASGISPMSAAEAEQGSGSKSPAIKFKYVCNHLEKATTTIPELYDAILIDEGQDCPPVFYRLAICSLKQPKRLYWAYDEAQGIGSLVIPTAAEVFGLQDGKPQIDLSGKYEGGIDKSHVFRRCYRTPEALLMVAHSVNMGLLREGGPLQGITKQAEWQKLGYEVEGDFRKVGQPIQLRRRSETQCHPVDKDENLRATAGNLLTLKTFTEAQAEIDWIAEQVALDVHQRGLQPTDLLVTALVGDWENDYFTALKRAMEQQKLKVWWVKDKEASVFRQDGHVTLANIYRAKGNEAWKVYAARFDMATKPLSWKDESELHKRNEAFVALTRTRLWSTVTGQESPIFEELRKTIQQLPVLRFAAFNRRQLKRVLEEDTEEGESG